MQVSLENIVLVGIGGFIGANVRYFVTLGVGDVIGRQFPFGTLLVNVTGSFLLAVFLAWLANHAHVGESVRLLTAVGFFGAYTTFSSFGNESIALLQNGNWLGGILYIVGTNAIYLLSIVPGLWLGSRL
jgi:CrcB protein